MQISAAKAIKAKTKKRRVILQPENYGYEIKLVRAAREPDGFRIESGCRNFTPAAAREHWKERSQLPPCIELDPSCTCQAEIGIRGRKMMRLLPKLAERAKSYGWLTATKVKRPRPA